MIPGVACRRRLPTSLFIWLSAFWSVRPVSIAMHFVLYRALRVRPWDVGGSLSEESAGTMTIHSLLSTLSSEVAIANALYGLPI